MRADRMQLVRRAFPVPDPKALLVRLLSYIKTNVGELELCLEETCIVHPASDYRSWMARVDHHEGCAVRWLYESPFKTEKGLLDALLVPVAINHSFCTEEACAGQDMGNHVETCLRTAVEVYLGWVKQDPAFPSEEVPDG